MARRLQRRGRAAFEQCYRLIKAAWTEDLVSRQGEFWRVPVPGTPWDMESTARYGGGVDNGVVTALGPVPKPLQQPHPPVFQPFASSERPARWCAEEGIAAGLPPQRCDATGRASGSLGGVDRPGWLKPSQSQ